MNEQSDEAENLVEMWDCINSLPESSLPIQIRGFMGGINSMQVATFKAAVADQNYENSKFTFTYVSVKEVKNLGWKPKDFVDWLLGSHVHFILSHVHQGLERLQWNLEELLEQLKRLKYHKGFPTGEKLECPIFTQDKYEYIRAIPSLTNETLKVELTDEEEISMDVQYSISQFINSNNEGCGWVVKAPFTTTNSHFIRY